MARKKVQEKVEEVIVVGEEKISFEKALKVFKEINKYKAYLMDREIVRLFVKKHIPSLEATQEQFNYIFKKF